MRVVLLAPTNRSLYSRLVARGLGELDGVALVGVYVRRLWSRKRIRVDLRREGPRLLQKVFNKLILPESEAFTSEAPLAIMAEEQRLEERTLIAISRRMGIPCRQVGDFNSQRCESSLKSLAPDLIVFTGGGLIRKHILAIPTIGVLNCHSGLLPRYRGMDTLEWSILEAREGLPEVGLTLHLMDAGVDTGPILKHHYYRLSAGEQLSGVRQRLEPEMVRLMVDGVGSLQRGTLKGLAQKDSDGQQYYVIHPRLADKAAARLERTP